MENGRRRDEQHVSVRGRLYHQVDAMLPFAPAALHHEGTPKFLLKSSRARARADRPTLRGCRMMRTVCSARAAARMRERQRARRSERQVRSATSSKDYLTPSFDHA